MPSTSLWNSKQEVMILIQNCQVPCDFLCVSLLRMPLSSTWALFYRTGLSSQISYLSISVLLCLTFLDLSVFLMFSLSVASLSSSFAFFFIHPQLSEQPFPCTGPWQCSELCGCVSDLLRLCFCMGGEKIWGWALVNGFQTTRACGAHQSCSKDKIIRTQDQKAKVYLQWHVFVLCPSFLVRSSQRLSNRWTMKPWCFKERPRSTATPTGTCCSAPLMMSRWVPSSFLALPPCTGSHPSHPPLQDEIITLILKAPPVLRSPQ